MRSRSARGLGGGRLGLRRGRGLGGRGRLGRLLRLGGRRLRGRDGGGGLRQRPRWRRRLLRAARWSGLVPGRVGSGVADSVGVDGSGVGVAVGNVGRQGRRWAARSAVSGSVVRRIPTAARSAGSPRPASPQPVRTAEPMSSAAARIAAGRAGTMTSSRRSRQHAATVWLRGQPNRQIDPWGTVVRGVSPGIAHGMSRGRESSRRAFWSRAEARSIILIGAELSGRRIPVAKSHNQRVPQLGSGTFRIPRRDTS